MGKVGGAMALKRLIFVVLVLLMAIIAFAWVDGGRESLRPVAVPVELPPNASREGLGDSAAQLALITITARAVLGDNIKAIAAENSW